MVISSSNHRIRSVLQIVGNLPVLPIQTGNVVLKATRRLTHTHTHTETLQYSLKLLSSSLSNVEGGGSSLLYHTKAGHSNTG